MKKYFVIIFSIAFTSCNLSRTHFVLTNESMLPTIPVGSLVDIVKSVDSLAYGDIIVYDFKGKDDFQHINGPAVSRIVGLPGDSIAVKRNICIVNGKINKSRLIKKRVPEDALEIKILSNYTSEYTEELPNGLIVHIYKEAAEYENESSDMATIKVHGNHYFLMGDFRSNSLDSRHIGAIPKEKIIGKVVKIKPKK
jgi:signal peptidase I